MVEDPIQRRSASTGVLFEGHAIDEILQWPDADLQALLLHGEPVVFKAGSACVLGSFAVRDDTLVMELGQIDGGGEGVLTGLAAPTMRVPMRLRHTVNACLAMKAILATVLAHAGTPAIRSVAIPGLGTGIGGLAPDVAARQMAAAYAEIVAGSVSYPSGFAEAQQRHVRLNPDDINLWDR